MTTIKILKMAFILAIILQIAGSVILISTPKTVWAADPIPLDYYPQIKIPVTNSGLDQISTKVGEYKNGVMTSNLLARYVKAFYDYGMAIAGILAAIVLMGGGVLWLTSAGNDSRITQAKELIAGSITGVVILFSSWVILNTINPDLLNMKVIKIQVVEQIDLICCQYDEGKLLKEKAEMTTSEDCSSKGGKIYTSITNVLGEITAYGATASGKKCDLPGCCIGRKDGNPNGEITKCANTMYDNCAFGFFMAMNCKEINGETGAGPDGKVYNHGCSQSMTDQCAKAKDGADCFDGQYSSEGACYNKICWTGKGEVGEPCGNQPYSKCTVDVEEGGRTCQQDGGGRSCNGENVWCCKYKENGLRLNN